MTCLSASAPTPLAQRIVSASLAEWGREIHEAPGPNWKRIREYMKLLGKNDADDYEHDGDAQWCGFGAGFILAQVGISLPLLRVKKPAELGDMASTYRLLCLANLQSKARYVAPAQVQPGDVVSLGRTGPKRPSYGEHIEICINASDDEVIETVGFNAYGLFPSGKYGQGVIRRERPRVPTDTQKGIIFGMRVLSTDLA